MAPKDMWQPSKFRSKYLGLIFPYFLLGGFCLSLSSLAVLGQDRQTGNQTAEAVQQASGTKNAQGQELEVSLQRAMAKGKGADQADALYDLAKHRFEEGRIDEAISLMSQCLNKEKELNRPQSMLRTYVALSTILAIKKDNNRAVETLREALELAKRSNLKEEAGSITNSLGTMLLVRGQLDQARELFSQAKETALREKNITGAVNALINLAAVARRAGEPNKAEAYLDEATLLGKPADGSGFELDSARTQGALLLELARAQSDMGKYDKAIESYTKAAAFFESELETISQAKALVSIGQIRLAQKSNDEALKVFNQTQELLKAEAPQAVTIDCVNGLGAAYAAKGDLDKAFKLHEQALSLSLELRERSRQVQALTESGYDLFLMGSSEKALTKFLQARAAAKAGNISLKQEANLLADIAMCYKALGQTDASINYYQEALTRIENAGDPSGRAMILNSLAVAYLDTGKISAFETYYSKAKEAFQSLNDKRGQAILAYNLAQFQLLTDKVSEALKNYDQALADMRAASDKQGEGQVLRGLGLACLYSKEPKKAKDYYQQALSLGAASNTLEAMWDSNLGLGKACKSLGETDLALNYLKKACDLVEAERAQLSRDSSKTFNMDLRQDCFYELVDVLVSSGRIEEALEVAERGRARAFLDLLEGRSSGTQKQLGQSISFQDDSNLQLKPISQGGSSATNIASTNVANANTVNAGNLNGKQDNLKVDGAVISTDRGGIEASNFRGVDVVPKASTFVEATTISTINAAAPNLAEIKNLVKASGSTFVEYYVLPDKVLIWVISPDGQIRMPSPVMINRLELGSRIKQAYESVVTHPKSVEDVARLNAVRQTAMIGLHKLLLEPVVKLLPASDKEMITIVPHLSLFSVPFAALLNPANGHFFIEDHMIGYTPAIGVLRATQRLGQETKNLDNKLLAFGNPITKAIAFLGTLPYAEKEVRSIATIFGANNSLVEIGEAANKAHFRALAPEYSVIHLATHGLINEEHPMESALVLAPEKADDGLLTVKDIMQLPSLKTKLVVLSACQTGRGKITGDGVVGLSRAFVIAGTPSIVVSQWNVDDVMTQFQMDNFYKSYLATGGISSALRDAQLKTIAFMETGGVNAAVTNKDLSKVVRANPRYWAAFQVMGQSSSK